MKTTPSKILGTILLAALSLGLNGCFSAEMVHRARGYTGDLVQVSNGDKVFQHAGRIYVTQHPKGRETSDLKLPDNPPGGPKMPTSAYLHKPRPAYYLLLPLTIPLDIVAAPLEALGYWMFVAQHPC